MFKVCVVLHLSLDFEMCLKMFLGCLKYFLVVYWCCLAFVFFLCCSWLSMFHMFLSFHIFWNVQRVLVFSCVSGFWCLFCFFIILFNWLVVTSVSVFLVFSSLSMFHVFLSFEVFLNVQGACVCCHVSLDSIMFWGFD